MFEQVAHFGSTHADEHLHKLTACDGEERHAGLTGHSAGQQRFAGARGTYEQHALGHFGTDFLVFLGVVQEVNDLLQALLGFVLTGNIMEFDTGLVVHHILLGTGFPAAEQH